MTVTNIKRNVTDIDIFASTPSEKDLCVLWLALVQNTNDMSPLDGRAVSQQTYNNAAASLVDPAVISAFDVMKQAAPTNGKIARAGSYVSDDIMMAILSLLRSTLWKGQHWDAAPDFMTPATACIARAKEGFGLVNLGACVGGISQLPQAEHYIYCTARLRLDVSPSDVPIGTPLIGLMDSWQPKNYSDEDISQIAKQFAVLLRVPRVLVVMCKTTQQKSKMNNCLFHSAHKLAGDMLALAKHLKANESPNSKGLNLKPLNEQKVREMLRYFSNNIARDFCAQDVLDILSGNWNSPVAEEIRKKSKNKKRKNTKRL